MYCWQDSCKTSGLKQLVPRSKFFDTLISWWQKHDHFRKWHVLELDEWMDGWIYYYHWQHKTMVSRNSVLILAQTKKYKKCPGGKGKQSLSKKMCHLIRESSGAGSYLFPTVSSVWHLSWDIFWNFWPPSFVQNSGVLLKLARCGFSTPLSQIYNQFLIDLKSFEMSAPTWRGGNSHCPSPSTQQWS